MRNKVQEESQRRAFESLGLEDRVFAIEIPTESVTEIKEGGRRVETEKKVLPGYVLVRMDLDDRSWAAVRNTPGVTGFVGSQGNPEPLTREEYNKIMNRTSREAPKKTSTSLEVGQAVKVVSGALAESMGSLLRYRPNRARSRFSLPSSVAKPPLSCLSIRWLASNLYNAILLTTRRYARVWTGLLIDTLCHIWEMKLFS